MKRILLLFSLLVVSTTGLYAQVGVGTTDPAVSAQLEVFAKDKGVLIPRIELTALNVYAPVTGTEENSLLVYNTTSNATANLFEGYYYWYDHAWNRVISQKDFSNTSITNTILKESNIVTYNPTSKTFNYYNASGTTSSVSVVDVINSSQSTQTIKIEKIKPGTASTVLASVQSGTEVVTEWRTLNSLTTKGFPVKAIDGVYFNTGTTTSTTVADAVLSTFTIGLENVSVDKLRANGTNATKDNILVVGDDNKITYTSTISADKIEKNKLAGESGSGITVENGEGIILGNKVATIKISNLPVTKLAKGSANDVLTTDETGNTVKWGKLSANNITGGDLIGGDGISVGNGVGALLKSATVSITSISIDKLTVTNTGEFNDKLLKVEGGKVVVTDKLPAGTTVSITNIRTVSPTSGTSTQVVTIDKDGNATTTTITDLLSNTITVGNGLSKDNTGMIKLGGKLSDPKTTITTTSKTTFAIEGLTHTATIQNTDKVVVLGDNNVMHTISATSFKGSGDYTTVTNTTDPSTINDQKTGNTFIDKEGDKKEEYIRTAYVTSDGSTMLKSKLLNVGATGVIITDIKITGADANVNAGALLSSVYEYKATDATSEATIGLGAPGGAFVSTRFPKGQNWYVIIKYVK